MIAIYGITIAISVWLFRDSRRRGKSVVVAVGWAVGGLLLPAIVHFVYLYGRLKTEGSMMGPPLDRDDGSEQAETEDTKKIAESDTPDEVENAGGTERAEKSDAANETAASDTADRTD